MITRIELNNFQSHQHNAFEFDGGVNAIIGPSDSGKTAILRALRWVIWNRPLGDAFRSDWGGDTSVTIQVPDNTIIRWKHDNAHGYTVNGNKLTAIKTDVPEDVTHILNIDEVNLQQQFDRPFLLDSSAGEVAAHFNKIAHLDIIDSTMKTLASWQRKLNQDVQVCESKINEYEASIALYEYLPDMERKITRAEKLQNRIEKLDKDLMELGKIIDTIEEINLQMEEFEPLLALEKYVTDYLALRDTKISLESSKDTLTTLVSDINATTTAIEKLSALPTKETCLNEAIESFQMIRALSIEKNNLYLLFMNIKETDEDLYDIVQETDKLQEEFMTLFPDTCPLCGSKKGGKK